MSRDYEIEMMRRMSLVDGRKVRIFEQMCMDIEEVLENPEGGDQVTDVLCNVTFSHLEKTHNPKTDAEMKAMIDGYCEELRKAAEIYWACLTTADDEE